MESIEEQFNHHFARWKIRLPSEDVEHRRIGQILHAGWVIWYLFGGDEKGDYLDYYASHRMTNDRHVRLRDSAPAESLPAIEDFRIVSPDPEEDARREAEYFARNQEVARLLEEKGFRMSPGVPGAVQINRVLRTSRVPKAPRSRRRQDPPAAPPTPEWASPSGCQPRLEWRLASGRTVALDGFYFDLAYSGLLEGRAHAEMNDSIADALKARAKSLFDEEPLLLETMPVVDCQGGAWLPPLRYVASLVSGPCTPDGHGSVLVVCGFAAPFFDQPLGAILASLIAELDWERHARDFWY